MIKIESHGFITKWLVSGPRETPFRIDIEDDNQLSYEKKLREIVSEEDEIQVDEKIKIGDSSPIKMPWRYYFSHSNWFVDMSRAYPHPTKVEFLSSTYIYSEKSMVCPALLWTYAAVDLYVGDERIIHIAKPVYKPIIQKCVQLKLKKGLNFISIRLQNLGVRDTRNLFGIQIKGDKSHLSIVMPDSEHAEDFIRLDNWLSGLKIKDNMLKFLSEPLFETTIKSGNESFPVGYKQEILLKKDWKMIEIIGTINGLNLKRKINIIENMIPLYLNNNSAEENKEQVFNKIAQKEKEHRIDNIHFSIFNILARCKDGSFQEKDTNNLLETLNLIEGRMDCADFLITGLIRLIKLYHLEEKVQDRIKDVLLNFRYWMDEKGSDGMCFWSENHALMFYSAAFFAGEFYRNEIFTRSGKKGAQLYDKARKRCVQWLDDAQKNGFEEFNSAGYMVITFSALLNLIDFADNVIASKAKEIADSLMINIALHSFRGAVISPQGRVYRNVIFPFTQNVQSLINMVDYNTPYQYDRWLALLATSKYQFPSQLNDLMTKPVELQYKTGNATVNLKKTAHYILTSIESIYAEDKDRRWQNTSENKQNHEYVKSLNEKFHGTTFFRPGVFGYQQHLWSAGLDNDCICFVNHPGGTNDGSTMRPGYWYGNGIIPALKQMGNLLGAIYAIPDEHPIHFTHAYWPEVKFEKSIQKGQWLFGKKGSGYIALWASCNLEKYDDQLFNCEMRAYSKQSAYIVHCSSEEEISSFDLFIQHCMNLQPVFDKIKLKLTLDPDFSLVFQKADDSTQYI